MSMLSLWLQTSFHVKLSYVSIQIPTGHLHLDISWTFFPMCPLPPQRHPSLQDCHNSKLSLLNSSYLVIWTLYLYKDNCQISPWMGFHKFLEWKFMFHRYIFFWEKSSLCNTIWLWTQDPSFSAPWELGLSLYTTMSWFSTGTIYYSQPPSLLHLLYLFPKYHHLCKDPALLLCGLIYAFPSAWNVVFSIWKFTFHPSEPRTDVTFFVKLSMVFLIIITVFICTPIAYIHM